MNWWIGPDPEVISDRGIVQSNSNAQGEQSFDDTNQCAQSSGSL